MNINQKNIRLVSDLKLRIDNYIFYNTNLSLFEYTEDLTLLEKIVIIYENNLDYQNELDIDLIEFIIFVLLDVEIKNKENLLKYYKYILLEKTY